MSVKQNLNKIEEEISNHIEKFHFSTTSRDCCDKVCYNRAS